MNKRKPIVGLCMLCALLVSAFAAQGASAITGTTAYTCVKGGGDQKLRGEHCLTSGITPPQEYGHVAIAQDKTTDLITTNAKTESNTTASRIAKLRVTIAGVPLELQATAAGASGWMENKVAANGEHYSYGEGATTFTGVTVKEPAGRGCKVFTDNEAGKTEGEEGIIHTRNLKATTQGQGDFVQLQPKEGTSFANFFITCEEGKKIPAIEGTWECSGSVLGVPSGATIEYTHGTVTTQNTLKCKGSKAGIDFGTTGSARAIGEQIYQPLSATTVTT